MSNIVVPIQMFGLGDIILCQTLLHSFNSKVLWPVLPQFAEGLNRAYPDITFIDYKILKFNYERKEKYSTGNMDILPIRWGDEFAKIPYRTGWMKGKYIMYGQDWQKWTDKAMWVRDAVKEQQLFHALGLVEDEPYTIVNKFFRSDNSGIAAIPDIGGKVVIMQSYEGYSLFDWAKVIEKASEIHTVSTAIIYIMEQLTIQAPNINLYLRKGEETDFTNVDYLLNKHEYILHY